MTFPFFRRWSPSGPQHSLSKAQVQLRISKSIDLILADWVDLFKTKAQSVPHDYASIYSPAVTFQFAPRDSGPPNTAPSEHAHSKIHGRLAWRLLHQASKLALRVWIRLSSFTHPRIACFPEPPNTSRELSFRWLVEGKRQDAEGSAANAPHEVIFGGMAHYRFDGSTGLVESVRIDRLIPPFRPGIGILGYLWSLQYQQQQQPAQAQSQSVQSDKSSTVV